jgi:D-alanyl-D-alanine carboxypeptidase
MTQLRRGAAASWFGLTALALAGCGQPASFEEALQEAVDEGLPGVAVWLRWGGSTWSGAAGLADIASDVPLSEDDRLLLVGATQPLLAAVALQLEAEGALSLDDTVSTIIGLEALYGLPDAQRMTVRHALRQSTGLHDPFALLGFQQDVVGPDADPDRHWEPSEVLGYFDQRGYRPTFKPGDGVSFSAANATLLGMVIEAATGRELAAVLEERVFAPAGVTAGLAGFGGPPPTVHPYGHYGDSLVEVGVLQPDAGIRAGLYDLAAVDPSWAWAAGGVATTVADFGRLADRLLAGMPAGSDDARPVAEVVRYGLGVMHRGTEGGPAVGHDGGAFGYSALAYYVPALDLTIVALANGSGTRSGLPEMFAKIVAMAADGDPARLLAD